MICFNARMLAGRGVEVVPEASNQINGTGTAPFEGTARVQETENQLRNPSFRARTSMAAEPVWYIPDIAALIFVPVNRRRMQHFRDDGLRGYKVRGGSGFMVSGSKTPASEL